MTTKDLKFVYDIYKGKDARGEKYYLNIKGIDEEGNEVIILDHTNNPNATGAKLFQSLTNKLKNGYTQIIVDEFKSFTAKKNGTIEPLQTHTIILKDANTPARQTEVLNFFGGLQGVINFAGEQAEAKAEARYNNKMMSDLELKNSQLLSKLGDYENENRKLQKELTGKEDEARKMRWEFEDELRKYKGQSAIITAGIQGLGNIVMKKLGVSGDDLAGMLGFDSSNHNQQNNNTMEGSTVQVEPDNVDPEIRKKADIIYSWLLKTNKPVMEKVYSIFEAIAKDEELLEQLNEYVKPEIEI